MKMPYGKYRGKEIHEISRHYLQWLLDNCDLGEPLKAAIEYGVQKVAWNPPRPFDIEVEADIRLGHIGADGQFVAANK